MAVNNVADILGLGVPELVIILVILLLIFGGKKLPELAKSVGSSVKELRKGVNDDANSKSDGSRKADNA
jgi:sec-independent protein translocase protein TatA